MQDTRVRSLGPEETQEKRVATHSSFLPGEFHGQGSLMGYSPWGYKELDTIEQLTHSPSITGVKNLERQKPLHTLWTFAFLYKTKQPLPRPPFEGVIII